MEAAAPKKPSSRKKPTGAVAKPSPRPVPVREMSTEMEMEAEPMVAPAPPSPHLKLYRRIAVTFVLVTMLMLLAVAYLSFSRATIRVEAAEQPVDASFTADVVLVPVEENEVAGRVVSNVFEQSSVREISGTGGETVEAKAGGFVTIYNNHTAAQPLVATTRLLSESGVLFRIDDSVTVPAGGSVLVMAHADQLGASGNIGPTRFTIPGLAASMQETIYAESKEAFTGGVVTLKVVTQEDLDIASSALETEMLTAAMDTLRLEAGEYSGEAFFHEVMERKTDTPPGTEAGSVAVSIKMRVVGVFFDEAELSALAEGKLYEEVPEGMDLVSVDEASFVYTVEDYDLEAQIANVRVSLTGLASLSATSPVLDKDEFLGKSAGEVQTALERSPAVESVEITFTPFWLKIMPTLKDHIKIIIE